MRTTLPVLFILGLSSFIFSKRSIEYSFQGNKDTIKVTHIKERRGRYEYQCYYFKDSLKVYSIGTNSEICLPYQVIEKVRRQFATEKKRYPELLNISPAENMIDKKTGIGLYYFSEGKLISHITYYKMLILDDSTFINVGNRAEAAYLSEFNIFKVKHAKMFSKKVLDRIEQDYLKVWN
ncbi:MAG: hypothetical protein H7Y04_14325 [Verrucomicrobia bacterium]|nr:hypothetical protein [Cytophagales bacterium]